MYNIHIERIQILNLKKMNNLIFNIYKYQIFSSVIIDITNFYDNHINLRRFVHIVKKHKDLFCFYKVFKGNDKYIFASQLLKKVNNENFERTNLIQGGISLKGWLNIINECRKHILFDTNYVIFYQKGKNLYYVGDIKGYIKDSRSYILLTDNHMERVDIENLRECSLISQEDYTNIYENIYYGTNSEITIHELCKCKYLIPEYKLELNMNSNKPLNPFVVLINQKLSALFCIKYILSETSIIKDLDIWITIDDILQYQPHINKNELLEYKNVYKTL